MPAVSRIPVWQRPPKAWAPGSPSDPGQDPRRTHTGDNSGAKALDGPLLPVPHIHEAVMQPAWASLPELNGFGRDDNPSPVRRPRHLTGEAAFVLRVALLEPGPARIGLGDGLG